MSITNDILGIAGALKMTPELSIKLVKVHVETCVILLEEVAERVRLLEGTPVADIAPQPICGGNVVQFVRS